MKRPLHQQRQPHQRAYHIQRGAPVVMAGPPGCGKSLAALWLALQGAIGTGNWFGLPIHCQFRTLILQNENGLARLHRDIQGLPSLAGLDDGFASASRR